ncbi:MAG: hypothetical protein V7L23_29945 [Nostoc sp.]|uniref:hypothetical protein n=1 Tax=Nostoc sp. TaxID=1180 RepID=UPI002FEE8E4B
MSYVPLAALRSSAYDYDQQSVPSSPTTGQTWRERDGSNSVVSEWFWNGTLWLTNRIYPQSIHAWSGQGVLIGGTIGDISATTDNIPFNEGNDYDVFLYKIHGMFRVISGNLSATNYWALQFGNTSSTLQSINITAGNGSETTGYVCKSSAAINTKYSKLSTGFNVSFVKNGTPPDMRAPIALIEYRLSR